MKTLSDQGIRKKAQPASQPFFSIIITTYNRALLLKRALNSLISQTESDWEAIIVDDGSKDDTYEQVFPYFMYYPKIKYAWKVHSGEALSKNAGIKLSVGRFVSFLDSDDEYSPEHLASRKSILMQNPGVKFLYGGIEILGNKYVPDRFDPSKEISLNNCVIGGTFFIERNCLLSLNGFRKILLGPDAELFDRVKEFRIRMMETNQPTYIYHHDSEDSITNLLISESRKFKENNNIQQI